MAKKATASKKAAKPAPKPAAKVAVKKTVVAKKVASPAKAATKVKTLPSKAAAKPTAKAAAKSLVKSVKAAPAPKTTVKPAVKTSDKPALMTKKGKAAVEIEAEEAETQIVGAKDQGDMLIEKAKEEMATINSAKNAAEKNAKVKPIKIERGNAADEKAKWQELYKRHGKDKALSYKMTDSFDAMKPLQHKVLGWGFILSNENNRLEVLFENGIKMLISNYKPS